MKEIKDYKATVEALLFASNNPISKDEFKELFKDISIGDFDKVVQELNEEYSRTGRSFKIEEIAGGWQMRTNPEFAQWIKSLLNIQRRERLSGPALETLAIIAYKQPITKAEIEGIRGVNVDWVLTSLVDKNLVRIVGRKEVMGRPFMYGTTTRFLEHFGLANLKDLPEVEELKNININIKKPNLEQANTGNVTAEIKDAARNVAEEPDVCNSAEVAGQDSAETNVARDIINSEGENK